LNHFLRPFTASIVEIDVAISQLQDVLSSLPKLRPNRFTWHCILAKAQSRRYRISRNQRDLDKSILQFTQAILHPFYPGTEDRPNLIAAFFFLTEALLRHTLTSRPPVASNIKYCIEYLYYLRGLSLEAFGIARDKVTASLVYALSLQTRPGSADVTTSLRQMIALCRELLTSDDLTRYPAPAIKTLARAVFPL
jgi:hypothetical protein